MRLIVKKNIFVSIQEVAKLTPIALLLALLLFHNFALAIPTPCGTLLQKQPPEKAKKKYLQATHPIITNIDISALNKVKQTYDGWKFPRFLYQLIAMDLNEDDVRTLVKRPEGFKINKRGDWLWVPSPDYVKDIVEYQDANRATKIKCKKDGLTMVGWYLPPSLYKGSPLEAFFLRHGIKQFLEDPFFLPLRPLFMLWDKIFPVGKIGSTGSNLCTEDQDHNFMSCTFKTLGANQNTKYFVTLLDLDKNDDDWLRGIKKDGVALLQDGYNVDLQADDVAFYFHWPTGAKTTTLHMHMRVNQGRLPTDNARSYDLDKIIGGLTSNKSGIQIVKDKYDAAGGRLVLANKDEEFEKMFSNANASISEVDNQYTPWWNYFERPSFDANLNTVTLRNGKSEEFVIDISTYGDKKLGMIQDKNGKAPFPVTTIQWMNVYKNVKLRDLLSANWPNWDGKGAEHLKPLISP